MMKRTMSIELKNTGILSGSQSEAVMMKNKDSSIVTESKKADTMSIFKNQYLSKVDRNKVS